MLGAVPPAALLVSALLTLPLSTDGGQGAGLVAAAAAAGRPPECSSGSRRAVAALARGPSVWERARVPSLERYCDLVARAQAQLTVSPEAARASARLADKALPGRAAPAVILARAALVLGAPGDAVSEFARARAVDPRSVEDPSTMHDLARALQKTGKREDALAAYRALVPRIDLLGTLDRRVSVLLEAAHASMAAVAGTPGGEGGEAAAQPAAKGGAERAGARLDEAIAYLREARQRPPTQLSGDVLLSLVLVLDRSGNRAQADAALGDAVETSARARTFDYLAAEEDRLALEALAIERSDPGGAVERWEAFLAGAGGKGPWAGAGRARLDALHKAGARAPRHPAAGAAPPAKPVAPPARSVAAPGGPRLR